MDYRSLPPEFQDKLAELEQEYKEGELTKKGFEKKKNSLLEEYRQYIGEGGGLSLSISPATIVSTSPGDGGVSPTNSINSGYYYIQQDSGYLMNSNQYNSKQQQYGGYPSHSAHHSLPLHVANPP